MILRILSSLVLGSMLVWGSAATKLYKWVDADGNVHYSDRQPEQEDVNIEDVELDDGYNIKRVRSLPVRRNKSAALAQQVTLDNIKLQLSASAGRTVSIGRAFYGRDCTNVTELLWSDGFVDVSYENLASSVFEAFKQAGYRLNSSHQTLGGGSLRLTGVISKLRFNACFPRGFNATNSNRASAYVKIRWQLQHGASKPLVETSEGAFEGMRRGTEVGEALRLALRQATDNLLASRTFTSRLLDAPGTIVHERRIDRAAKVALRFGDGNGEFRDRNAELLRTTVTIRLPNGHGSGVIVDPQGYILTNAHVVQKQTQVDVVLDDGVIRGKVVGYDRRRDIALIKTKKLAIDPARISRSSPSPGDPLYVIGTPLDESFSHTVTQGILSAKRNIEGQSYLQTDAAINRGNSGGPVFDEHGELIGISVAGIFTSQGASLNLNYVIPIDSALAALAIP